jgi:hypothetical protein
MGITLNQVTEGAVAWFPTVDGNWTTLEQKYVAQEAASGSPVTVANTTSETVLMNNTTIPANALGVGTVIPNWTAGTITIPASTTPSVTWNLRWGGLTGTILASFTWNFGSSGSAYTQNWQWDFRVIGISTGSSGSAQINGWIVMSQIGAVSLAEPWDTGVVTLDTTTSKALVWTVQSTVAAVSTTQRLMYTDIG